MQRETSSLLFLVFAPVTAFSSAVVGAIQYHFYHFLSHIRAICFYITNQPIETISLAVAEIDFLSTRKSPR